MNWVYLIVAGFFEAVFVFCMGKANQSESPTSWFWWMGFGIALLLSMYLMHKSTIGQQAIPIGTAYLIWTGIGTLGSVLVGIVFFKEPITFWRIFFMFTLIASLIGLRLVSQD